MTSPHPISARVLLIAGFFMMAVSGCASIKQAVDSVRGGDQAPPPEVQAEPAPAPAPEEAPPPPEEEPPKPAVRSKPKAVEAPAPAPKPVPAARPAPKPSSRIPGPAWLSKCATAQMAGGVVRCDTDLLIAKPSPTVQVFTRDPARVVAGKILLRKGLPHIYRLYVVP